MIKNLAPSCVVMGSVEDCVNKDDEGIPPRVKPKITAAPRARQMYWCDFWPAKQARLPEFYKTRPVVVLSHSNKLSGHCLVIPVSSAPQSDNRWSVKLSISLDGRESWAVCNHIYTVSTSRLHKHQGKIPKLSEVEFGELLKRVMACLPKPR